MAEERSVDDRLHQLEGCLGVILGVLADQHPDLRDRLTTALDRVAEREEEQTGRPAASSLPGQLAAAIRRLPDPQQR